MLRYRVTLGSRGEKNNRLIIIHIINISSIFIFKQEKNTHEFYSLHFHSNHLALAAFVAFFFTPHSIFPSPSSELGSLAHGCIPEGTMPLVGLPILGC